ncbi:hypothetical protein [Halorubrum tebenquichense]|uniref:hypothetical protein n=1 Tax=Halorubrum tebenquichense TaxID=119434 RepID=UPI00126946D8|nr:hypothetical protein [Halorubrum tebenquichense]
MTTEASLRERLFGCAVGVEYSWRQRYLGTTFESFDDRIIERIEERESVRVEEYTNTLIELCENAIEANFTLTIEKESVEILEERDVFDQYVPFSEVNDDTHTREQAMIMKTLDECEPVYSWLLKIETDPHLRYRWGRYRTMVKLCQHLTSIVEEWCFDEPDRSGRRTSGSVLLFGPI